MISERIRHLVVVAAAVFVSPLLSPTNTVLATDFEAHPLRPPDTSSPRDTLSGFLSDMEAMHLTHVTGNSDKGLVVRRRLVQMVDFSETANSHLWREQSTRLAYLKEILDRIPLPPLEQIPGDREVADGKISSWTIPDTRISIVRVDDGERAGEYLFSAASVAKLDRYYRQSKHLPYKPGASVGFLKGLKAFWTSEGTIDGRVRSQLKPIDDSNPREVMQQFLASVNGANALIMEADAALRAAPPAMTRAQALESERRATTLIGRAVQMLDLSEVPDSLRKKVGVETALRLKEVLDRSPLPPIESIPGLRQVEAIRTAGGSTGPIRWVFPQTEIEIAELTEGPEAGQFRFSARTVARARDFYSKVRDLPYRGDQEGMVAAMEVRFAEYYASPEVSRGLYEYYISTPGYLIPGASRLGPLLTDLPAWLTRLYLGQTVWQWIGIALAVLAAVLAFALVYATGRLVTRHMSSPKVEWIKLAIPLVNAVVVVRLAEFVDSDLNVTGSVVATVVVVSTGVVLLFIAGAAFRLCVAIGETIVASPRIAAEGFDANLLRLGARAVGFVVGVYILVVGVQRLGADVVPLLAGLGIGGLAVALAVRPTLENMISGIILYTDRPVNVGDFCTYGEQMGTVERIGLRSTRIRGLDRTVTTVPNSALADMQLTNWAPCDAMLITTVIGLRYDTTPEQLRHVLARMRQVCFAHPKIDTQSLRVRFTDFGASSLDVTVRVYALANEWSERYAIREDLYLRFMEVIEESGTSVAIPSRTLYLGRDSGLDPERIEAAERDVAAWREADELPFPYTPEPLAARITDTLDYPPRGSPEAIGEDVARIKAEPLAEEDTPDGEAPDAPDRLR